MKKPFENGVIQRPLYHGTTSLFVNSIKEHGLGGLNPVEEWDLVSIYRALFEVADKKFRGAISWEKVREKASYIAYQKNSNDGLNYNFRHGNVYLTPIRKIAFDYASINEGSELLGYLKGLVLYLIHQKGHKEVNDILPMKVASILSKSYQPVLLRLESVCLTEIEPENGMDKDYLLSLWQNFYETGAVDKGLTNWKLTKPLPWGRIEVLGY